MSALVPEESDMATATPGNQRRLKQTKAQVEEVVEIVRINVDKMLERNQKLSELDHRVEVLQTGASQFSTTARKVKRKYWWKNCKMLLILITVIILILLVIIIWYTT